MSRPLLAGLTPNAFLRRHWQKRPLLARQALPWATQLLTRADLFRLAMRDDVQTRLVRRSRERWSVAHGPFSRRELARLPARNWTLLAQGVNHVLPQADELLRRFSFIPYARLDDVMVSYAPPGGGVGPHFDSYDVFLLQLAGTRRWQISTQTDLALVENAPLKLLRNFRAKAEWLLAPGDMLYLPPRCAHDGVAIDECLTASVGFRAPGAQELGVRFLEFVEDHLELKGAYSDPRLRATSHPARLGDDLLHASRRMIERVRWRRAAVAQFLGCYLTEPKPHVVFGHPPRPLGMAAFARQLVTRGARHDLKTLMLYRGRRFFVNGTASAVSPRTAMLLSRFADQRRLDPGCSADGETMDLLYQWYRSGYIHLGDRHSPRAEEDGG